jgi:Lon protease-like protein
MDKTKNASLGDVITSAILIKSLFSDSKEPGLIEINLPGHSAAAVAVWRMQGMERSPKQEEQARRLVASYNACLHEPLEYLESDEQQDLAKRLDAALNDLRRADYANEQWERAMKEATGEDGLLSTTEAIAAIKESRDTAWIEVLRLKTALKNVTNELRQLHAHHYRNCAGGCPAEEYIAKADALLAPKEPVA